MTPAPEKTSLPLKDLNAFRAEVDSRLDSVAKVIAELRDTYEKRIADLEQQATLFEEHRQATIRLNEQLRQLKEEIDRDDLKDQGQEKMSAVRQKTINNMIERGMLKPEDRHLAALFDLVLEHCTDDKGRLNSWGRAPYTHALRLLAEAEFIRIDEDCDDRILATPLPKGDLACKAMVAYMPPPDGQ